MASDIDHVELQEAIDEYQEEVEDSPPWEEEKAEAVEAEVEQEEQIKIVLTLKSRAKGKVRCKVERVTVMIDHAFGEFERYKGRNAQSFLNLSPTGLTLEATLPEDAGLDDFVAAIVDSQVLACEVVVTEAESREEVKRQKREAEIRARVEEEKRKDREIVKRAAEEIANRIQVQTF